MSGGAPLPDVQRLGFLTSVTALAATEVIPSARRLIRSLRDLGYDISAALADLVDNSIAAAACNVWIDTNFDGEDSWVRVLDDGIGMTEGELREAMRFGTRRVYTDSDLGRFGLGLKSASLSQCRSLTVASRTSESGRVRTAKWDLDHIEQSDRWEVLRPKARECALAVEPLRFRRGTVVVWERMDRVARYRFPDGRRAQSDFDRLTEEIKAHLAMTFHRFLNGEARFGRRICLYLNGTLVEGWDPFCRREPASKRLPLQRIRMQYRNRRRLVIVRPYVLPAESGFSSLAAHRRAAGPHFWARQQGFYFYRQDRLIQAGGWSRMRTQDEHTKLARIAVDIPTGTDDAFELNVSKTQVRIPPSLRGQLTAMASSTCRLAEETYRRPRRGPEESSPEAGSAQLSAVATLVRMVIDATDQLLTRELADSIEVRVRLVAQLRAMESDFLRTVAAKLGIATS
jgi:hypothetical protein